MSFFAQFTEGVIGTPSSTFYRKTKEQGGYRIIGAPNKAMEEIQGRISTFLQKIAPKFYSSTAQKGGLGSVRNGLTHGGRVLPPIKFDLAHAFDSVRGRQLAELVAARTQYIFRKDGRMPNADEWFEFLSRYCFTRRGGLIQGALTSPILLDWYCEVYLDKPIRALLSHLYVFEKMGKITYTRYFDDLAFSVRGRRHISRRIRRHIRQVFLRAGFLENHWKTEIRTSPRAAPTRITGVQVGGAGHFGLPRKKVKEIERLIALAIEMPLFAPQPEVIKGKARYLLEVLRGKPEINKLEARALMRYQDWCERSGHDDPWVVKVLMTKRIRHT